MPKAKTPAERLLCAVFNIDPDDKHAMKQLKKMRGKYPPEKSTAEFDVQCKGGCANRIPVKFKVPYCNRCISETVGNMGEMQRQARALSNENNRRHALV